MYCHVLEQAVLRAFGRMCVAFLVCVRLYISQAPFCHGEGPHTVLLSFNFLPEMQQFCGIQPNCVLKYVFHNELYKTGLISICTLLLPLVLPQLACGSGCTSKLLHVRAAAWKVEAFPPSRHVLCISVAASTIWLKYPLYSIPLYFLSIWHSCRRICSQPPSLGIFWQAWLIFLSFAVGCFQQSWDLFKLLENERARTINTH